MAFRDRTAGGGGLDGTPGFMIKAPGTPHSTQLPDWKSNTEIRIFPAPKTGPDGPKTTDDWHPLRNSIEYDDFGPAAEVDLCCRKIGVFESFTYITRIPGSESEDPTTKLCKALVDTAKDSPHDLPREWCGWTRGGPGKAAKVAKTQNCIFFQAAALTIKGKPCKDRVTGKEAPRFPVLFMGSLSLLMTFSRLGNTRIEGVELPPQLPPHDTPEGRLAMDALIAKAFALGDWCSAEHGRIMRIFQAEQKENERPHYDIEMMDEKPLSAGMQTRVRTFWTPWPQLLRYHTAEQQIGYLKRAFPKEVLDFALGRSEYEGLLPDGVRGSWQALQNRMTGAWTSGIPETAQNQMQQNQQVPPPPPSMRQEPPPQSPPPQAPAEDDGWGDGAPSDDQDSGPAGPAMPDTPAELAGAAAGRVQQPQTPPTTGAPATPNDAVRSGTVDPAKLAETLDLLNSTGDGKPGNAGEL